jgi:hypothetical protein
MTVQIDLSEYDLIDEAVGTAQYHRELDALWDHVEANLRADQFKDVAAFTWRDEYMSPDERRANTVNDEGTHDFVYSKFSHLNAVRLTGGGVISIPVIKQPTIPDAMRVRLKRWIS